MPKVRLADRFIAAAKPTGAQTDFFDEQVPGLFIRVSATKKTFGLVYSRLGERTRARVSFGSYPAMSLAAAQGQAIQLKGGLDEGRDASSSVAETKAGIADGELTVKRLAALFVADRRQRGRPTADEMERALNTDVIPVIGTIGIQKLRRVDLSRCTDKIKQRGAGTQANRTAALLRAMLGWATDQGHVEVDVSHRWKAPAEAAPPRERAFSAVEIRTGLRSQWVDGFGRARRRPVLGSFTYEHLFQTSSPAYSSLLKSPVLRSFWPLIVVSSHGRCSGPGTCSALRQCAIARGLSPFTNIRKIVRTVSASRGLTVRWP